MNNFCFFVVVLMLILAVSAEQCPVSSTSCPGTCCKVFYSASGYGCCPLGTGATCCMNSTDDSGMCCPAGTKCTDVSGTISCLDSGNSVPATYTCKPGPEFPPSSTLPNCLILGDSVSIGYTPYIKEALKDVCFVQHTPWDTRDGGATNTGYGLHCLKTFLRTAQGQEVYTNRDFVFCRVHHKLEAKWDLIQYNFGLHDIDASTEPEYAKQLGEITQALVATKAKLIYATTTPAPYAMGTEGATIIKALNDIAKNITAPYKITTSDLYGRVTSFCGTPPYANCSICRVKPCSYHYDPAGYQYISDYAAPIIKKVLGA